MITCIIYRHKVSYSNELVPWGLHFRFNLSSEDAYPLGPQTHNWCHWIHLIIKTLNYNTPSLSCQGQITLSIIDEICPLAIPNQISFISMHVPGLVKIPWHLLKLLSWNENMDMSWADNSIKIWPNLPICNPKPDLHNINAHTKLGENPWHVSGRCLCQNLTKFAH